MMLSFGLCWVLRVLVFHSSWCELMVVSFDDAIWAWVGMVEAVWFRQMLWLVMLKFAKDRVLEVDTPGQ
jgi:hypothetical protein